MGKRCGVWFGENIGGGADEEEGNIFNELRGRWRELVERDRVNEEEGKEVVMGVLSEGLKYGKEAIALREECTLQVRRAVLEVRRQRGLEDEDEKAGFVETWRVEGGKREGKMGDGSWVKDV